MLDAQIHSIVKQILFKYLDPKKYSIFIFGSRAMGKNEKYSDIDIGIEGRESLPLRILAQIQDAFEESDLPFRVDVVDFSTVSDKFRHVAKQHTITL